MTTSKYSRIYSLALLAFLLSLAGCKTNSTTTPWEQVTAYSATFADSNQAIEMGTQTLVSTRILSVGQAAPIIRFTLQVAQAHQQITAILAKGSAVTSGDLATITTLLQQIQTSGQALINSGALGIKNPTTQNTISQDLAGLISVGNLILNLLPQLLAAPAPSTVPVAPAGHAPAAPPSRAEVAPPAPTGLVAIAVNPAMPLCAKRCDIGAPTVVRNSCNNFLCANPINPDGSACFTLASQTVNGKPCAWTYPPCGRSERNKTPQPCLR